MESQQDLFEKGKLPLPQDEHVRELSELVARYRVAMNRLVGRILYLERRFRKASDAAGKLVGGFVERFLESCATVPEEPEEWNGGECYTSDEAYECIRVMYVAAKDVRNAAKKIVVIRRYFYRDLKILQHRHQQGESAFDREANLRIDERRQWTALERKEIWERSGKECYYCGKMLASFEGDEMHVDHRVPVVAGGGDDLDNLVAACPRCNLKKNAKSEDSFLQELARLTDLPLFAEDWLAKAQRIADSDIPLLSEKRRSRRKRVVESESLPLLPDEEQGQSIAGGEEGG